MAVTLDDDSSSCVHRNTVIWTSKQLELDHIAGILIILRTIFQEWLWPIAYVGQAKWNKGGKRIKNFVVWSVVEGTIWKGKKRLSRDSFKTFWGPFCKRLWSVVCVWRSMFFYLLVCFFKTTVNWKDYMPCTSIRESGEVHSIRGKTCFLLYCRLSQNTSLCT